MFYDNIFNVLGQHYYIFYYFNNVDTLCNVLFNVANYYYTNYIFFLIIILYYCWIFSGGDHINPILHVFPDGVYTKSSVSSLHASVNSTNMEVNDFRV